MSLIKRALKIHPALYMGVRALKRGAAGQGEPEVALLPHLVDRTRLAVDVGANTGIYTDALRALTRTVAIEANPVLAKDLAWMFGDSIRLITAAVSNTTGTATLRVPVSSGQATIAPENNLLSAGEIVTFETPLVTLDGLGLDPVGFIKIDIEGHELAAIEGAQALIARDKPAILVEAEERHRPRAVASIREKLEPMGYRGLMLDGGRLVGIERFDLARDQTIAEADMHTLGTGAFKGRYINNFIFIPA